MLILLLKGNKFMLKEERQQTILNEVDLQKAAIAAKAVSMLRDGAVIFIDGGTTCMELARIIPENLNLTCFTISLPVAMELSHKANINVISIGGQISKEAQISIGANAIHHLSEVRFDYSFIGTGYVDAVYGLTEFDWDIVQIKHQQEI